MDRNGTRPAWDWNSAYWRNLAAPWGGAFSTASDIARFLRYFLHTDSTVLRNAAVGLGHSLIAYESCQRGIDKLEADPDRIGADLADSWEVLAEAVQTVMRRHGIGDAYEQLKKLTRGRQITERTLREFIGTLDLPDAERQRLSKLVPADYIGLAGDLAKQI